MKKAIKLVLIYFLLQLMGVLTSSPLTMLYVYLTTGSLDFAEVERLQLAPAMLLGFLYMMIFLHSAGYLKDWRDQMAPLSVPTLVWSFLGGVSVLALSDALMSQLTFLPNLMEQTFDTLLDNWPGILCVALLGPVLEEWLFRGAITKVLLQKYEPTTAILLSGLVFGVFHINPAQVVSATLMGFFFAWLYYKTRILLPCILLHVFNNSLSAYLIKTYPEVESTAEWIGTTGVVAMCVVAAVLLALAIRQLNRKYW